MQIPTQIATVVVTSSGIHYGLVVPAAASACMYILVWSQGLRHYSLKFAQGSAGQFQHMFPLPVLDYTFDCFVP